MAAQPHSLDHENAKKALTACALSLADDFEELLKIAIKRSLHPADDDRISELPQGKIVFVSLLEAMSEMMIRLLKLTEDFRLFRRMTKSLGGKLEDEFNIPSVLLSKAWDFGVELKTNGFLEVPDILLEFINRLKKCAEDDEIFRGSLHSNKVTVSSANIGSSPSEELVPQNKKSRQTQTKESSAVPEKKQKLSPSTASQAYEPENISVKTQTSDPMVASVNNTTLPTAKLLPARQVPTLEKSSLSVNDELWAAVYAGDVPRTRASLVRGADVESTRCTKAPGHERSTPLHHAAFFGQSEMVELLLEAGANLEATNDGGYTPLHAASCAWDEKVVVVRQLLAAGAEVNTRSYTGETPLHLAVERDYEETVRQLLEAGADIGVLTIHRKTELHFAGKTSIAQLLIQAGANVNKRDIFGLTPLHQASRINKEFVQLLIEAGANVNQRDNFGVTPLHLASGRNEKLIRKLLEAGAEVGAVDYVGQNSLHVAVDSGRLGIIQLLLQAGIEINSRDNYGRTPLYLAAALGQVKVVRHLLEAGADTWVKDRDGWTLLHTAARHGHLEIVKLLVQAEINKKDKDSITPLDLALKNNHESTADYLRSVSGTLQSPQ